MKVDKLDVGALIDKKTKKIEFNFSKKKEENEKAVEEIKALQKKIEKNERLMREMDIRCSELLELKSNIYE